MIMLMLIVMMVGDVVQRHGSSGNPFKDLVAKSRAHSGAANFDAWRRACHAALPAALAHDPPSPPAHSGSHI